MRINETYKLQHPQVLTGLFKSEKAVFRAQAVLTDFGYPKDAAKVTEVDGRWQEFRTYCSKALHMVKSRLLKGILIGVSVAVVIGIITQARFFPMVSIFEGTLVLLAWAGFALMGAVICAIIGALLMMMIYSYVADEYQDTGDHLEENVLISVAVNTPADARDIAREWEEIGGKVV